MVTFLVARRSKKGNQIGRLYAVLPTAGDKFYLRMLLCQVNINIELRIIKIWDRALMTHTYNVLAVSRMLKDITNNDNFFGAKIVIFCDDPRQTLPVTPKAS